MFSLVIIVLLLSLRLTGSAYWEPVRGFLAPIFVTGSLDSGHSSGDKPGIFAGGITSIIDRVSPTKKFENTTFLVVGIGGRYHDGGNLTDTIQVVHFE